MIVPIVIARCKRTCRKIDAEKIESLQIFVVVVVAASDNLISVSFCRGPKFFTEKKKITQATNDF